MQLATITSKRQITLPSKIATKLNLRTGQKIYIQEKDGKIEITLVENLIEELAGSLVLPKKWKRKSLDQIIEGSKKEYFFKRASSKK